MLNGDLIKGAVMDVTKAWAKQRKSEEKESSRRARRLDALIRRREISIKEAAYEVLEKAYMKASSNNALPAHARQIMYAARGYIQERTGKRLRDDYFTQTLLPDYINDNPETTAGWDVVYDARGHLIEPHTGETVQLGTLGVRRYLGKCHDRLDDLYETVGKSNFPTVGPKHRYGAILFIEKEGFMPLFQAAKLAERFDIAIMSTKGVSNTASRQLVDTLCMGIPLLIVRDFDKAGFSIAGTLQRDTRRYEFGNDIEVTDLGLRLEDVKRFDLESEDVFYRSDPDWNLRKNGATDEEVAFLRNQRVELNAFTSGDFIKWLEAKLKEVGVTKVIPDEDRMTQAYRLAIEGHRVNQRLEEIVSEEQNELADREFPDDLVEQIQKRMESNPELSWDRAMIEYIEENPDSTDSGCRSTDNGGDSTQ